MFYPLLNMTTRNEVVTRPKIKRQGHPQIHPNSLANLKPYKKGENGHGQVYPLKERLRHALDHPLKEPGKDAPMGERIVYATLKGALDCEPTFSHLKEVWDRTEGKVPEKTTPPNPSQVITNFVFILPDGTKVSPEAMSFVKRIQSGINNNRV